MRHVPLFLILSGSLLTVLGCDKDAPTAPTARTVTALPPTSTPTVTPTPRPGPIAVLRVTLNPAGPFEHRHATSVHIEAVDVRGVGFEFQYGGLYSDRASYAFPSIESGISTIRVSPFGTAYTSVLVEADEDVPCAWGAYVLIDVRADDGRIERVSTSFDCSSPYWPF